MVVTFVSNYINHHQLPFCNAMNSIGGDVEFYFIQTMPMEEKRRDMGWGVDEAKLPYLVLSYEDEERAADLIRNSDVVLFGWTEGLLSELRDERLSSGKLSFCVSERIYREGQWKMISPKGLKNKYMEHVRYKDKPVYLLCTGAYVASDFALIGSYPGKMLKWGYFPDASAVAQDMSPFDKEIARGIDGTLKFCWAGRLVELKHPEFAVRAAAVLKKYGYRFKLDLIGDGPMMPQLQEMVKAEGLEEVVNLTGAKKPEEVLEYMKNADIFLFTSNYLEGWGAVVNEAMECGCAVIASEEAGAVPFLVTEGYNGLTYKNGDYKDFENRIMYLIIHRNMIEIFGEKAKETIDNKWNAKNAALELVRFCKEYMAGKTPQTASEGPMSVAHVLKAPGVIRTLQEKNHLE